MRRIKNLTAVAASAAALVTSVSTAKLVSPLVAR